VGYKRNPKVYHLVFDASTEYPGLEADVRTLSMGQLLAIWTKDGANSVATFDLFIERLVGWNLEDETGAPVPIAREAVLNEDDDLVQAIVKRWTNEVLGVPAPLESGSDSGETSQVEALLTEVPSQSLAS
jgi:hypothetical protein